MKVRFAADSKVGGVDSRLIGEARSFNETTGILRFIVIKVCPRSVRRNIDRDIVANPVDEIVAISRIGDDLSSDIIGFVGLNFP
jgi:hypothetical protein